MKNFGWKKIRKFPARKNVEHVMRFALEFKRKFPNFDVIKFFQKEFGQDRESTSERAIKRWLYRPPAIGPGKIHTFALYKQCGNFKEFRCKLRKKRNCSSFIIVHDDLEIPEGEAEWISHFANEECSKHKEWHKDKD